MESGKDKVCDPIPSPQDRDLGWGKLNDEAFGEINFIQGSDF